MDARLLLLSLASGFLGLPLIATIAQAQITPDGTLNTTVTQSGLNYTITNGTAAGTNLYHSFSQFSLPTGGSATFDLNATPAVRTIFSRVTGGSVSQIDGLIRTLNSSSPVSLFLMNPAGIIFGANASLNIGGSFTGTTANSIHFADGSEFSAIAPSATPLLTISVPIGLQMGQTSGSITVRGSGHRLIEGLFQPVDRSQNPIGLQVAAGNTLALIGSGVNFAGGIASVKGGGHVEVGSVRDGIVKLNPMGTGWVGDYASVQRFNDIHLTQQSLLDASGKQGSIQIQGRNISLTEGSTALLQNFGAQAAGGITVNASETLKLAQNTADGKLPSLIRIDNLGNSQTGTLTIAAAQLFLQNGGTINTQTFVPSSGGNIVVNVAGSIVIDGSVAANPNLASAIVTTTAKSAKAGDITVSTGNLRILNGASISSLTLAAGQTGKVQIMAQDLIEIAGVNPIILLSSTLSTLTVGSGNANSLFVNTSRLVVREGALVGSNTSSMGSSGNVIIQALESVVVQGKSLGSANFGRIASTARISDPVTRAAFGLPLIPSGDAGSLTLNTPSLRIADGASVTVKNDGSGRAGDLQINANSIALDRQGSITASTVSGNGGNVQLNLQNSLILRHGSLLSATALGRGDGGNVTINAPIIAGFENSDIIANTVQGRGGNIQINTQGIFGLKFRPQLTPANDITASSEFGVSGNVQISHLTVDPTAGIVQLPVDLVDPSRQIATSCNAQGSRFVATGRGGLPPNPNESVGSDRPWSDIRDLSAFTQSSQTPNPTPNPQPPTPILEATAFIRTATGDVELIAMPASGKTEIGSAPVTCATAKP